MADEITYTRKDFRVDTFRAGGKGGQNQNKLETGVRITHIESGLSAESRTHRTQRQNKIEAFNRLADKLIPWIKKTYFSDLKGKLVNKEVIRTYNVKRNTVKNTGGVTKVAFDTLMNKAEGLKELIMESKLLR